MKFYFLSLQSDNKHSFFGLPGRFDQKVKIVTTQIQQD